MFFIDYLGCLLDKTHTHTQAQTIMVEGEPKENPGTEDKEATICCYYSDPSRFVYTKIKYLFASGASDGGSLPTCGDSWSRIRWILIHSYYS